MPGMVRPWSQGQANLADNLRPHVQSNGGIFPLCKRQSRPNIGRAVHFVLLLTANKIGKRAFHALEHTSRFILGPDKRVPDASFHIAADAASFSLVIILLRVLLARASQHSLVSLHCTAIRTVV